MSDSALSCAEAQYFKVDHLRSDLRGRSVRGGAITLSVQAAKFALRMGSIIVLARLLLPQDYGLVAMVSAVIGLAGIFRDMGLSTATIQRPEINHRQVSNLFWINVLVGALVTAAVAALGPILARLYGEPRLTWITAGLSLSFVLAGLSVQHQALLIRQMRFVAMGIIEIVSMAISIVVGVIMAWRGAGYWSLVGMALAAEFCDIILSWALCGWRPGMPGRGAGVRSMLSFGGALTVAGGLNYVSRNADNVLIGWWWGAAPLGLYSRAYQLFMLPIQQINTPLNAVVVPALSQLSDDPARFRRYFSRLVAVLCATGMPLAVMMAVLSEELVAVVLGPRWSGVTPIFRVLSVAAVFQSLMSTTGWLYIVTGRMRAMLGWTAAATLVFLAAFVIGLPYGAVGVAISYVAARLLLLLPSVAVACHRTPITVADALRSATQPLLAACAGGVVCLVGKQLLSNHLPAWVSLMTNGVAAAATALAVLFAVGGTRYWLSLWKDLLARRQT